MKKTVAFKSPPPAPDPMDSWVTSRTAETEASSAPAPEPEPMKRFTIDVPESLHRRVKARCAERGVKMTDVLREMLERDFPT